MFKIFISLLIGSFILVQASYAFSIEDIEGYEDKLKKAILTISGNKMFDSSTIMSDFSLNKQYGVYKIFGDTGPGTKGNHWNRITIYIPTWDHRNSTTYHFNINMEYSNTISSDALIENLKKDSSSLDINATKEIKIAFWWDYQEHLLEDAINDFVETAGTDKFAITLIYNNHTDTVSLEVNVDTEDSAIHDKLKESHLVKIFTDNIRRTFCNTVDLKVGKNINDTFQLKRSIANPAPVIILYLLGTVSIKYTS